MSLTAASADWEQELVEELPHHRRRLPDQVSASGGQLQLKRSRIGRVIRSSQQSGLLQRTHQLRDEHDLQSSEVCEFPLARLGAAAGELAKRSEEKVVGVRQPELLQARSTATRHLVERCQMR